MLSRIVVSIFVIISFASLTIAQSSDSEDPYGLYSLSPEARLIYEEYISGENLTDTDANLMAAMLSNCTTIASLRTFFTPPDVDLLPTVQIEIVNINNIQGTWFTPTEAEADKVILYLHGGAFIFGSVENYTPFLVRLADNSRYRVFSIDYRLAPEYPFPAGLDDVETSYFWLVDQGYSPENIIIAGDSAGGNLAVELMLRLRDAGEVMPAGGWIYGAVLDFTRSASTEIESGMTELLGDSQIDECYLDGVAPEDPRVSPLFADLTGLPPLLITVGTEEGGLGASSRFARVARRYDVAVTLDVWDGLWHVWAVDYPLLPESIMLYEDVTRWIQGVWHE